MKSLVLTGLANEVIFGNEDQSIYLLVFNNGEFRVPTTEEGARTVLELIHKTNSNNDIKQTNNVVSSDSEEYNWDEDEEEDFSSDDGTRSLFTDNINSFVDEDGIPQL